MRETKDHVASARVTEKVYNELEKIADIMKLPKGDVIAIALENLMNSPALEKIKTGYEELEAFKREALPPEKATKKNGKNGKALARVI